MALKAILESLEGLDAHFADLYTQQSDGKYLLTGVEGMKPVHEFEKVHGGLTKERNDHKATKTLLGNWAALGTIEDVQAKLDRIPELEAASAGKLDEAGIEKLVSTRLQTKLAPMERTVATLTAQVAEKDALIGTFQAEKKQRTIHDALRQALALPAHEGFQKSAVEDALMLADRMFDVDEDGNVVTKDGVGVTPGSDPASWLIDMQQKRPHWWGGSQGGGAQGGKGGQSGVKNPWDPKHLNLTEQGRIYKEDPARARQMAKQHGVTL